MKYWMTLVSMIGLLSTQFVYAQELSGCGHLSSEAELLELDYLKSLNVSRKTHGVNDTIPVQVHLVANDVGIGRISLSQTLIDFCELNEKYKPVGIYFFLKWPIKYINNSSYFNHDFTTGAQMMNANNVNNAINIYFVGSPAGNCGYYTYGPDAVAIGNNCALSGNTTITHELGHYFSMPHTFRGWENGNTPTNPEYVTRGNGKNCDVSGDRFCDTEADYISTRWACPYTGVKQDGHGDFYHPDSSNYMSYSFDQCASRFSNQQIQVINNNKDFTRTDLLNQSYLSYVPKFDTVQINNITDTLFQDGTITWNAINKANAYHIKLSFQSIPNVTKFDTIVTTNSFTFPSNLLNNGSKYVVRIKPMNNTSFCENFQNPFYFVFSNKSNPNDWPTGINNTNRNEFNLYIANSGGVNHSLTAYLESPTNFKVQWRIINSLGQSVAMNNIQVNEGHNILNLEIDELNSGLYILELNAEGKLTKAKFMVR